MKFTVANCMDRINQALNYPSVSYDDVSTFFDQAISELNLSLHTGIKPISVLIDEYRTLNNDMPNLISLLTKPTSETIIDILSVEPSSDKPSVYYNSTTNKFGVLKDSTYTYYTELYAIYNDYSAVDGEIYYKATLYSSSICMWQITTNDPLALDLLEYLTVDFLILYVIPYVCFKYSARDGGNTSIFLDEYTQGFTNLQENYDIPYKVYLPIVADRLAYKDDVEQNLSKTININVPTRAIYESMRVGRNILPSYGGIFDRGGWGI